MAKNAGWRERETTKRVRSNNRNIKVRAGGVAAPWCWTRHPLQLTEGTTLEQMDIPKGTVTCREPTLEQGKCVRGK